MWAGTFAVTVSREELLSMKGPAWRTNDLLRRVPRSTCKPGGAHDRLVSGRSKLLLHRENCRPFVFDPWNQHDEESKFDTETQYVKDAAAEEGSSSTPCDDSCAKAMRNGRTPPSS